LITMTNKNIDLAEQVKNLSAASDSAGKLNTPAIAEKRKEMVKERKRCETLKGVVQGIIVGSGIDWASDEALRRLVLECGDDA
jgi:hypothetical protein